MKTKSSVVKIVLLNLLAVGALHADPQITSWLTTYSGQYARIYASDAAKAFGTALTSWSNGRLTQALPAYCGVQEILSSSNWVYVRSTGLGSYTMGPWYNDPAHSRAFPNLPVNQKFIYRLPRIPSVPSTHTFKRLGEIGFFVDGVRMFDAGDAFSYSTASGQDASPMARIGQGDRIWNRDAWVNERTTFDAGYAHQQNTGRFHYHANPIALRYLLGDHVDYDATSKTYHESAGSPAGHSPIIGWMQDGFPLYGPYGYSNATNAASGVRRMISGYVLRNGMHGTINLFKTGRHSLPAWGGRAYNRSTTLSPGQYGPSVSAAYPIGHYLEDYDYLGDDGGLTGSDFDLDEFNGRWCVTPDFPSGTYAYFSTINSDGNPAYPYNMGRLYYGNPSGSLVASINEAVTTNFLGGADAALQLSQPAWSNNVVTLFWSAVEGGTYLVESTSDNSTWSTRAAGIAAVTNLGKYSGTNLAGGQSFRVKRTALAGYDAARRANAGGNGILNVTPASGTRGRALDITINLDDLMNPPPRFAPINLVKIGGIAAISNTHVSQTRVTSKMMIPAGAPTGTQTVSITFPGPPDNPAQTVTYTLVNGFTIN